MKHYLLKTCLAMLCLLLGIGSAWADSYTITFGNSASGATALSASVNASTVISNGTSYVNTKPFTINSGNCYYGDTKTCIRLGKSGVASSLSIALSATGQVYATKVTVNCDNTGGKNNTDATLSVNNTEAQTTTTSAADYDFTLDGTKIESLTLAASASVRVYSITVTYTSSSAKTLSSIAVKTAPTKVTYTEGEFFAPAGLVVTKTYDDASTEDVSYASNASAFTFTPSLTTALQTSNASVQISVGGKSTTQTITVNALPSHTARFSVNGTIDESNNSTVKEGASITFPSDPSDIDGKKFQGWTKTADYSNATTAPSDLCKAASMGNADVTYYAVFATQVGSATPQTVTWNINGVQTSASGGNNVNTALKTSSVTPSTETGVWTAVASASYAATSSSKAQLGSSSYKFAGTITLSGSAIPSTATITKIDLTATSSATDANPYSISATVNDVVFGTTDNISSGNANCSWSDNVVGNSIVLTTSCGYNKNIVISAISVTYSAGSVSDYCTTVTAPAPTKGSFRIGSKGFGTYFTDQNYVMPAGVEGGVVVVASEVSISWEYKAGDVVPAETALLLKGTAGQTYEYEITSEDGEEWQEYNNLIGTIEAKPAYQILYGEYPGAEEYANNDCYFYKLTSSLDGTEYGWYWGAENGNSFNCAANKCVLYLTKAAATQSNLRALTLIGGDSPTSIEAIEAANANATIFDLQGRRVRNAQNGVYVVNGKKVIR